MTTDVATPYDTNTKILKNSVGICEEKGEANSMQCNWIKGILTANIHF